MVTIVAIGRPAGTAGAAATSGAGGPGGGVGVVAHAARTSTDGPSVDEQTDTLEWNPCGAFAGPPADWLVQADTSPQPGSTRVRVQASIQVRLRMATRPEWLSAQTVAGPCTGTVQVSSNDFRSCVGFATATPTTLEQGAPAEFFPQPTLAFGTSYRTRVIAPTVCRSASEPLSLRSWTSNPFSTVSASAPVVVSQVFGGYSGFVELHNRTQSVVSINGWSLQISSGSASQWQVIPLEGSIAPGAFFLVRSSVASPSGATFDLASGFAVANSNGKVALVRGTLVLAGACPGD